MQVMTARSTGGCSTGERATLRGHESERLAQLGKEGSHEGILEYLDTKYIGLSW